MEMGQELEGYPLAVQEYLDPVTPRIQKRQRLDHQGMPMMHSPLPQPAHLPPLSKWKEHVQFATLCFVLFLAGWNDGTTGPLLPRIQSNYHVSPVVLLPFEYTY